MKVYNVIVNDKEYEVEVRGKGTGSQSVHKPVSVTEVLAAQANPEKVEIDKTVIKERVTLPEGEGLKVQAPMPGKIMTVNVKKGETVALNQTLCTLEAMKMENEITSPGDGLIEEVYVRDNDHVDTGDVMFVIN